MSPSQKKIVPVYNLNTDHSNQLDPEISSTLSINKSKAKKLRLFAFLSWFLAIGIEVAAYFVLQKTPINFVLLTVLIVLILIFAILGSYLWKKANRLDPASKKNKIKFFIQNQLGVIMSLIAFAPLIILIFMNKDMSKKQKGIFGSIAVIALLIAGVSGADFNPPSLEKYKEQTEQVKSLNGGNDYVYWTKSGKSYHLFSSCSYINSDRTTEIFEGTVAQSRALKNITDLCDRCEKNSQKNINN